jgi:SRSO17 transposase
MLEDPNTAPSVDGVLVIDEHGVRKRDKHTAHVGRRWLANIGETESGVASVTSLLADEKVYSPIAFKPYALKEGPRSSIWPCRTVYSDLHYD